MKSILVKNTYTFLRCQKYNGRKAAGNVGVPFIAFLTATTSKNQVLSLAEMFRFRPSNLTRFTAEPLKRARYCSTVRLCQSAFVMASSSDLG